MHQSIPKNELNMYGYPVCPPQGPFLSQTASGLVVTKSDGLVSEIKNSVIVKHEGKTAPHHLEPRVSIAHSPSPKLRNEMLSHYQVC